MSFATIANLVTIIFCAAVLVQSVRMMRSLASLKATDLPTVVSTLDNSTAQARFVLTELKETLRTDGTRNLAAVREAAAMRDELELMVGIANASADRLVDSVAARRDSTAGAGPEELAA